MGQVFHYSYDDRYRWLWRLAGARPDEDRVEITDDGRFVATFGRRRVDTPIENVDGSHITRDYRWWTAIGTRLSLRDDGLTFGTNTAGGVCVHFRRRIPHVLGFRDHSALTVTVDDLEGLEAVLGSADG